MWTFLFIASAAFLVVDVQGQCGKPPVRPTECCSTALSFVKPEQATACGLKMGGKGGGKGGDKGGKGGDKGGKGGKSGDGKKGGGPPCEVAQCVFNQNNLLGSDGKVNRGAVQSYLSKQYSAEWQNSITNVVNTCNSKVSASESCDASKYLGCLMKELPKNCPDSLFTKSDKCNELKTFWSNCPSKSG